MFNRGVAIMDVIPEVRETTAIAEEEYSGYSSQHRRVLAVKLPPPIALERNLVRAQKKGLLIKSPRRLKTKETRISSLRYLSAFISLEIHT